MKKAIASITLAILALGFIASLAVGQIPKDPVTDDFAPMVGAPETEEKISSEMDLPDIAPSIQDGFYINPESEYQIGVPEGWLTADGAPGLIRSPDETGLVGYADQSGLALLITQLPNEGSLNLQEWINENNLKAYLRPAGKARQMNEANVFTYRADWGELGVAYGALISQGRYVYRVDCFYPAGSRSSKIAAQKTLQAAIQTFAPFHK